MQTEILTKEVQGWGWGSKFDLPENHKCAPWQMIVQKLQRVALSQHLRAPMGTLPMSRRRSGGAVQVQSEIYQYRCRVLEYLPRQTSSADIEERIYDLLDNPPALPETASPAARSHGALKGINLRGQTEPKRRFAQICADLCRFSHLLRKQSIWERQKTAGIRRKLQFS